MTKSKSRGVTYCTCSMQGSAGLAGKMVAVSAPSMKTDHGTLRTGRGGSFCERGRWPYQAGSGGGVMKRWGRVGLYSNRTARAEMFFKNAILDETAWRRQACPQL